jgi:hypothetical protein
VLLPNGDHFTVAVSPLRSAQLQAAVPAEATLLVSRIPYGNDGQRCMGAIILKSNEKQLPAGVAVAYELNGVAASKPTNTAGRISVVSSALPAGSTTCTLKVVSATSQGEGLTWHEPADSSSCCT